jgi:hypothetical protein
VLSKLLASSAAMQQQSPESFETKVLSFSIDWYGCEVLNIAHLFAVSF